MQPPSKSVRYFSLKARGYTAASDAGLWAWQRRREAKALFMLAAPLHGRSALDLGCGSGYYAKRLVEAGAGSVWAVDAAPEMADSIIHPNITVVVGDAATVSLKRQFDRVILAGVLEFADYPEQMLANAVSHLAENGRIIILAPPDNTAGRIYRWYHKRHGVDIQLFSLDRISSLARVGGLFMRDRRHVFPYSNIYALERL